MNALFRMVTFSEIMDGSPISDTLSVRGHIWLAVFQCVVIALVEVGSPEAVASQNYVSDRDMVGLDRQRVSYDDIFNERVVCRNAIWPCVHFRRNGAYDSEFVDTWVPDAKPED